MQSLVLHIGTHKTGTTSIQRHLASLETELRAAGVLYPVAGRIERTHHAQHLLARSIRGLDWPGRSQGVGERCWSEFLEEAAASDAHTVVLSSEWFDRLTDAQIETIADRLSGFRTTIVVYLRNQLDFAVSAYKERVKAGYYRSFRSYLRESRPIFEYGSLVESWTRVFGQAVVEVRLYDKVKREPGVERDFLSRILPEADRLLTQHPPVRANVAIPDNVVPVFRCANAIEHALGRGKNVRRVVRHVRGKFQRGRTGEVLLPILGPFVNRPLYEQEDVAWLRQTMEKGNAEFLNRYVAPEDRWYFDF